MTICGDCVSALLHSALLRERGVCGECAIYGQSIQHILSLSLIFPEINVIKYTLLVRIFLFENNSII